MLLNVFEQTNSPSRSLGPACAICYEKLAHCTLRMNRIALEHRRPPFRRQEAERRAAVTQRSVPRRYTTRRPHQRDCRASGSFTTGGEGRRRPQAMARTARSVAQVSQRSGPRARSPTSTSWVRQSEAPCRRVSPLALLRHRRAQTSSRFRCSSRRRSASGTEGQPGGFLRAHTLATPKRTSASARAVSKRG